MILISTVDNNKDKHTVTGTAAPAGLLLLFDCRRRGSGFCGGLSGERSPPRSASYGPEMERHKYDCKLRLKKYLRNEFQFSDSFRMLMKRLTSCVCVTPENILSHVGLELKTSTTSPILA